MKIANEIKIFKLVDGSFCIGKVDRNEEFINDVVDIAIQAREGGVAASLMPYMFPFNNEMAGVSIKFNRAIAFVEASPEIILQYSQATSGIIPAAAIPKGLKVVK